MEVTPQQNENVNLKVNANDVEHGTPSPAATPTDIHTDVELDNSDQPSKDAPKPDPDCDDDEDEPMFDSSTHGFLIYFDEHKSISKLIVSIFVIVVQFCLYMVIMVDALKGVSGDDFTIPVKVRFGRGCNKFENLVCPPELPNMGYTALAGCILAFFLMHDIIAGFRIIFGHQGLAAKLGGVVILSEAVIAALCGTLFALSANENYDAIANCIGVLFIHDVDEKAFEAFKAIKFDKLCKLKEKLAKFTAPHSIIFIAIFGVIVFSMSLGGIIRSVQLKNIKDEYGDKYVDKFFKDGWSSYAYDWSDGSSYDGETYWDGVADGTDGGDDDDDKSSASSGTAGGTAGSGTGSTGGTAAGSTGSTGGTAGSGTGSTGGTGGAASVPAPAPPAPASGPANP